MEPFRVLLVEDNLAEARLVREAVREHQLDVELVHARDGREALGQLDPSPDLVLLDLNMPGMDGRALLPKLRSHHVVRSVPVVVLSLSDQPDDVRFAYAHHANAYVCKPMGFDDLGRVLRRVFDFYFRTATLVRRPA